MTKTTRAHRPNDDRGIALILTLFLLLASSVIVSGLMFLGQNETYAGTNYRLMSQARYGAESGIEKAANFLLYSYTPPQSSGTDPISAYTYAGQSPVLFGGKPVVLSANGAVSGNYPIANIQTAFAAAATGSLPAGSASASYAPYATLMSMQQVSVYGGGVQTIQTWAITSDGTINSPGGRTAQVEVTAVLETQPVPAQMYAAFGVSGGCGALDFKGNKTTTDSYDSQAALVSGVPVVSTSGGNVGTNGNLTEAGGATINGSLSTPRVGVGNCSNGNVDALSSSGGAAVTAGIVQLSQAVAEPTPPPPNPLPPTTNYSGNNQTLLNGASVGNVSVNAGTTLTLGAPGVTSTIVMNSLTLSGNANVVILGTVILEIAGQSQTTPIDLTGGSVSNASYNPANFQVQYGGTGNVNLTGGAATSMMVYAPAAAITFSGNSDFYGSVVGNTVTDTGGTHLHYDRNLSKSFYTVGNAMMSAFSWKKY